MTYTCLADDCTGSIRVRYVRGHSTALCTTCMRAVPLERVLNEMEHLRADVVCLTAASQEMRRELRDITDLLNAGDWNSAHPFIGVRDMSDEVDRLRAEVARLTAERDQARAKIAALEEEFDRETSMADERARNLAHDHARAIAERDEARAQLRMVHTGTEDGVWFWQGDGDDKPESLSCPVVMSADTLHRLQAAHMAEVERLTRERDERERAVLEEAFRVCVDAAGLSTTPREQAVATRIADAIRKLAEEVGRC